MLERADEHHRALVRRDPFTKVVAVVQLGRQAQPEHADDLVDGCRRPRAGEDHASLVVTPDGVADDPPGVLTQAGGLQPGPG
ncbi:MAG: hypothetical protein V9E89_13940 [Ilumatobacteraceae bacterium]